MRKARRDDDLIALMERIIAMTEEAGEEQLTIPTHTIRTLLEMAKAAELPQGRQQVKGRDRVREAVVIAWARRRKAALIAAGMKKGAAHEKASEEAAAKLRPRNVGPTTVARRMQRRRPRQ